MSFEQNKWGMNIVDSTCLIQSTDMYMAVVVAPMEYIFLQHLRENMKLSLFVHIHRGSGTHFHIHTEFDVKIWVPRVFLPPNLHTAVDIHTNTSFVVKERSAFGYMDEKEGMPMCWTSEPNSSSRT